MNKEKLIQLAQEEANVAVSKGNPPFGAVLIDREGAIIATAHNTQQSSCDPVGHAEINLLRKAGRLLGAIHFQGYTLITNAEPCPMCMAAIIRARISSLIYGASHEESVDPHISATELATYSTHLVAIEGGVLEKETGEQILRGRELLRTRETGTKL